MRPIRIQLCFFVCFFVLICKLVLLQGEGINKLSDSFFHYQQKKRGRVFEIQS
jgi:hypothetical protein